MFDSILNWFSSSVTTWLIVVVAVATGVGGYAFAAYQYKAEIAEMKAANAAATKEHADEYRKKEQEQAASLAEAWSKYEKARAESIDLRSDVERVRKLADSYRSRLPKAGSGAVGTGDKRNARCAELLTTGAELVAEGARISQQLSAKKDALATIKK